MKDSMGDRMKDNYEKRNKNMLPRRGYVLARIDGKAFHSYTKRFEPFDPILRNAFEHVAKYLIKNVSGCRLVYLQSDEITLLLTDFDSVQTDAWYGNNQDKLNSVLASMVTAVFNKYMYDKHVVASNNRLAMFDCRTWYMADPFEVANQFIWRQKDWIKNSVQMFARQYFPQGALQGKKREEMLEMCLEKGHDWNELPNEFRNGILVAKDQGTWRGTTPIFTENRNVLYTSIPTFFINPKTGEPLSLLDAHSVLTWNFSDPT